MNTPKFNKNSLRTGSLKVSKEQSRIMVTVGVATIITVFCLMSSRALVSQAAYQRRVVNARHASAKQLKSDISNANTLVNQYNSVFIGVNPQNIIGGRNISGVNTTPPDGDNGQIVLDALPTVYDFPALLTSVSQLLNNDGIGSPSIGGTDQSSTANSTPTGNPQPVSIDLTVSGSGTYSDSQKFINDLERSIRPFDITHLTLTGNESALTFDLDVTTYYQPAKTLNITAQEIH